MNDEHDNAADDRAMLAKLQPLPRWQPANNGSGKRIWFLIRNEPECIRRQIPLSDRYHYGKNGYLIRYASHDTAQRAADRLNAREAQRTAIH